jgi:predicted alpha/beta superfamily hydrolase
MVAVVTLWLSATIASGLAPFQLSPTTFTLVQDVGFGNSVFVRGNVAELGGGSNVLSRKLAYNAGNVWSAVVALPPNVPVTYRFVNRLDSAAQVGLPTNGTDLTADQTITVPTPAGVVFEPERVLFYHSGWTAPVVEWELPGGSFAQVAMTDAGPGRGLSERLWRASGIGTPAYLVRFRIRNGVTGNELDTLPGGVLYSTYADRIILQDGHIYNYMPHPSPSASRIEVIPGVTSPQGLLTRSLRVYLPRGYDEHTSRRYPVLYMHDGNNIFGATGPGFPPVRWNVDGTLDSLIRQAQVREIIVVGIDNTAQRNSEYIPPPSNGDNYLAFVRDTVKPLIDATYRTQPEAEVTGVAGSSLGGLISTYFGLQAPETFRRIGAFSPSFWANTNTLNRLANDANLPPWRIYLDSGNTGDASNDGFINTVTARDHLLRRGLALNRDVHYVLGVGDSHNEAAWQSRFPGAIRFLYPIEEEPATLPDSTTPLHAMNWMLYDE